MNWNPTTRRHFLQGPGKAALILPVLPSLLSNKQARAASVRQKSFIGVELNHGMTNMYSPTVGAASDYMPVFKNMQDFQAPGRHVVHYKTLEAAKNDGGGQVSTVFDAAFNPYLPKMLMLQGLDFFPFGWYHHSAHFGNTGRFVKGQDPNPQRPEQATIDQVMATLRKNFTKNPALLSKSVSWTGNQGEYNSFNSFGYADPNNRTGSAIVGRNGSTDPQAVWDLFFKNFAGGAPPPAPAGPTLRQKMVDHVLVDYKAFLANPRLGGQDRMRVQRHIDLLNDTQKSLSALGQPVVLSCNTAPAKPAAFGDTRALGYDRRKQMLQAMNSVVVSLIACGLCHTFTSHFSSLLSDDTEKWHAWAHSAAPENKSQASSILHDVVLDLVTKLDQSGLLDDSLVMVPQEHNKDGHQTWSVPLVTFGSAGGTLKTGQYIDYRMSSGSGAAMTFGRYGFPMTQAFATMLMAMDVPASEFESLNRDPTTYFAPSSGYGSNFFEPGSSAPTAFAQFKGRSLSEWLPLVQNV